MVQHRSESGPNCRLAPWFPVREPFPRWASSDKGFGAFNWSGYSNRQVDALLERAFASVDEKRREALARDAMRLAMRDHAVIALHHQVATWAMRKPLAYAPRTDEFTLAHQIREK